MRALGLMTAGAVLALAACGGGDDAGAGAPAAEDSATPAAATTGTAATAAAAGPATVPKIRPGLWRLTKRNPDADDEPDERCVTAAESERMARDPSAALDLETSCPHTATRQGSGVLVRFTCPEGVTAQALMSGDFQNSYTMDISLRLPLPEPTEIKTAVQGTRIGDC